MNNENIELITGTEIPNNENKITPYVIAASVFYFNNPYSRLLDIKYYEKESKIKKNRRKTTNLTPKKKRRK
jgi:hypothetical protein